MKIVCSQFVLLCFVVTASHPVLAKKKKENSPNFVSLPERAASSGFGDFVFRNMTLTPDNSVPGWFHLNGSVANTTGRTWTKVILYFELLDKNGQAIEPITPLIYTDFRAGQTRVLATEPGEHVRIPNASEISGFNVRFASGLNDVDYQFRMTSPRVNDTLEYEDSSLRIAFAVRDKGILIEMANKLGEPIRIDWNQCSYIDPFGISHGVTHNGLKYNEAGGAKPPTTVPPMAKITDAIIPADKIHFEAGQYGGWTTDDILTRTPAADGLKGRTISVFFPLEISGKQVNYMFSFRIDDVIFR